MMKVIVVTGGIGSGKSEVCRILEEMGFDVQYNADSRVKALYTEVPGLLEGIEKSLDLGLRGPEGRFMPGLLAERIFSDKKALDKVESLVFPALVEDFSKFAGSHPETDTIIFESATVLEKEYFSDFADKVILVDAPYLIRLERACLRDGAEREKVEARMANQKLMNSLSEGYSDSRVDAVIMNDAGLVELKERTRDVISRLIDN